MNEHFLSYKYQPLLNLFNTDYIQTDRQKDYIPFGEDNLLPQQIIQLSRYVSIHRAILNSKSFYIAGNGFVSEDANLKVWLEDVNGYHEDLRMVFYKLIFDELNTGNAYLEIITDSKKSFIYCYHIDSSKCRLSADEKQIIVHPDWKNYKGINDKNRKTISLYPKFNKGSDGLYHAVMHIKQYEPEFYHYGLPTWYAGVNSVLIAGLTDVWNKSRLENQFNAMGLLIIPGVNNDEEAQEMDEEFAKFKGFDNEKSYDIIIQYLTDLAPGQTREKAQYIEFKKNEESNWVQLHQQAHTNLLSIHNWFKSLASFFGEKTGFDTQRIINEYEIALKTTIKTYQGRYIDIFRRLLTDFGFNTKGLTVTNESPVYRLNPVMYIWELRREMGLEYNPKDPNQQVFYSQLRNTFKSEAQTDIEDTKSKNDADTKG